MGASLIDSFILLPLNFLILLILGSGMGLFWIVIARWLYFVLMEISSKKATLGKMALGLEVVDLNYNRISFGKATGRHFGKIISAVILDFGFMMAGFTDRKQGLHDMMSGCLVVKKGGIIPQNQYQYRTW